MFGFTQEVGAQRNVYIRLLKVQGRGSIAGPSTCEVHQTFLPIHLAFPRVFIIWPWDMRLYLIWIASFRSHSPFQNRLSWGEDAFKDNFLCSESAYLGRQTIFSSVPLTRFCKNGKSSRQSSLERKVHQVWLIKYGLWLRRRESPAWLWDVCQ